MPRSNRPRRRPASSRAGSTPGAANTEENELDLHRALYGTLRTEAKHGGLWNVQPISPTSAVKTYVCPGCGQPIPPGQAHVVAWRADGLMGEAADVAARRHWHAHCWKVS